MPAVRRRWPELTGEQLRLLESEIARARNLASALSVDDLLADAEEEAAA